MTPLNTPTSDRSVSQHSSILSTMLSPGDSPMPTSYQRNREIYGTLWPNSRISNLPSLNSSVPLVTNRPQNTNWSPLSRPRPLQNMPQNSERWQIKPSGMNPLRKQRSDEDLRMAYEELLQLHPLHQQNTKNSSTGLSASAIRLTKPMTPASHITLTIDSVQVEVDKAKARDANIPQLMIIKQLLDVALEWETLEENVLAVGWKDILLTTQSFTLNPDMEHLRLLVPKLHAIFRRLERMQQDRMKTMIMTPIGDPSKRIHLQEHFADHIKRNRTMSS